MAGANAPERGSCCRGGPRGAPCDERHCHRYLLGCVPELSLWRSAAGYACRQLRVTGGSAGLVQPTLTLQFQATVDWPCKVQVQNVSHGVMQAVHIVLSK